MTKNQVNESFPIRTVSEITGVNAVTLRAWERRYGLIKPSRTPKGHRIYSREDIRLIQEILERLSLGMSISQITREVLKLATVQPGNDYSIWEHYGQRMIGAIVAFDEQALDTVYNDAMALYPVDIVTTHLIMPLLGKLGSRWRDQQGSIAEEHFFSVYLRNKLGARFHHQNLKNTGPVMVVSCLPGEHHEFGILLFALMAHSKGYRIVLLGSDLPVAELIHVVNKVACQGIVLAGAASLDCATVCESIETLTRSVDIPVFIGGDVAHACHACLRGAGAHPLGSDLARSLQTISDRLSRLSEIRE